MLTMLMTDQLQAVSSNQCLCCYTGLKLSWPRQDKTPKRGCRWPAVENSHRWCTSWRSRGVHLPWQ